MIPLVQDNNL